MSGSGFSLPQGTQSPAHTGLSKKYNLLVLRTENTKSRTGEVWWDPGTQATSWGLVLLSLGTPLLFRVLISKALFSHGGKMVAGNTGYIPTS